MTSFITEKKEQQLKTEWRTSDSSRGIVKFKPKWEKEDMDFSGNRIVTKVVLEYNILDFEFRCIAIGKDIRFFCMANASSLTQYNVRNASFDGECKITFENLAGFRDLVTPETTFELHLPSNPIFIDTIRVHVFFLTEEKKEKTVEQPQYTIDQIVNATIDNTVLQFEAELQDQIVELKKQHAQEVANLQQAISEKFRELHQVRGDHAQQVVRFAGHGVALDDFRKLCQFGFELAHALWLRTINRETHKRHDTKPHFCGFDNRCVTTNHAALF